MKIECTAPERSVLHMKDLGYVQGKPHVVAMKRGDKIELAETSDVLRSRAEGEISRMEKKGWITVLEEPKNKLHMGG